MYTVYVVQENGDKTFWKPAGVAFKNKDGSINLKLDLFPNVHFQLREKEDEKKDERSNRTR